SPLLVQYDKHLEEMSEQLQLYQVWMLHADLKEAVEKQLETLPFVGTDISADEEIVRNLQEQLQLASQEKEHALQLWQSISREFDELQQQYQQHMTETQIHVAEKKKQKVIFIYIVYFGKYFYTVKVLGEYIGKRKGMLQAKIDGRTAAAKVDEMTRLAEKLQGQLERKEEDMVSAQQREEASDKRLQQMQSSIKQLEARLRVTVQDAEQLRTERAALEKQIRELQTKCATLEKEKYSAVTKVQDSIQLLEEANLQKSQVDSAKKQYNVQISRLTEELSALQMECGEKQSQIERVIREKRAVEEELEKIYREDRGHESDSRKLEQLHQKYLLAECTKGDLQLSLQTAQNKLKQLEMNSEEEKSHLQEMICKLQSILDSEREKSGFVSEQRLKLQQENEQLQKEMEGLRKLAVEAQQKAKIMVLFSTMEHEHSVKEHGYEARLQEMQDSSQKSTAELRRLLVAQQKATNRWKEETKNLTDTTEVRINKLKSELSQQKLRTQELLSQLEIANEKAIEDEKLMMEYREYINRLQRRLSQAEQRAATASQKLSVITAHKKAAASLQELENT
uniref:Sodium channel and clathrin linker 1 n=1 Tax=Nothoprocta perdicaria TaxID=30464 RepID=A0A8C7EEU6_NOTPE